MQGMDLKQQFELTPEVDLDPAACYEYSIELQDFDNERRAPSRGRVSLSPESCASPPDAGLELDASAPEAPPDAAAGTPDAGALPRPDAQALAPDASAPGDSDGGAPPLPSPSCSCAAGGGRASGWVPAAFGRLLACPARRTGRGRSGR